MKIGDSKDRAHLRQQLVKRQGNGSKVVVSAPCPSDSEGVVSGTENPQVKSPDPRSLDNRGKPGPTGGMVQSSNNMVVTGSRPGDSKDDAILIEDEDKHSISYILCS
jgi:hypothetical protein